MTKDIDQEIGQPDGKRCSRCGEWKVLSDFGVTKNRKGDRIPNYHCKACEVERTRTKRSKPGYREKEREKNKEYAAEKRATDPEYVAKRNETNRLYASKRREDQDHRDAVNLFRRVLWATSEEYREKTEARARTWISDNLDRWRAIGANRRSLERGAEGSFSPEDIEAINETQGFECVYCGESTAEVYHIDHKFPIIRGGSNWPENLQILCPSCNCSKRDKTHEEYLAMREATARAIADVKILTA